MTVEPNMPNKALALALVVRLSQALLVRTAFAPDEYWQSIEVAHRLVFGWACCVLAIYGSCHSRHSLGPQLPAGMAT